MQQALIQKFKTGNLNTLVATCVAEEGLDIGAIDLIISYDCLSSPIRMV
jgi:ERCC4-related helicase